MTAAETEMKAILGRMSRSSRILEEEPAPTRSRVSEQVATEDQYRKAAHQIVAGTPTFTSPFAESLRQITGEAERPSAGRLFESEKRSSSGFAASLAKLG